MTSIDKLASVASEALGARPDAEPAYFRDYELGTELFQMLRQKNGFYAFEQALHVLPVLSDITHTMTLEEWNSNGLWRNSYDRLSDGLLFFAEDIFGDQFCLSKSKLGVFRFDAEYGSTEALASSIEEWAHLMLTEYDVQTGWSFANEWQTQHGEL